MLLTQDQIDACIAACVFPDENGVVDNAMISDAIKDALGLYAESQMKTTLECVQAVINLALARDEVVTIRLVSGFPPRMGAYLMVPDVRAVVRQPVETHADTERWHDGVRPVLNVNVPGVSDVKDFNALTKMVRIPEFTPDVPLGVHVTRIEDGEYLWSDNIRRTRKA
jgi:hypothetical protein